MRRLLIIFAVGVLAAGCTPSANTNITPNTPVINTGQTNTPAVNTNPPSIPPSNIKNGMWGGIHIQLTVSGGSSVVEFDCAHGTITSPITLDKKGQFSATGIYSQEHGGPVREGEPSNDQPAVYAGIVSGNTMSLTITLSGTKQMVGTYDLTSGTTGRVFKCL